jgi:hypothetical protein
MILGQYWCFPKYIFQINIGLNFINLRPKTPFFFENPAILVGLASLQVEIQNPT